MAKACASRVHQCALARPRVLLHADRTRSHFERYRVDVWLSDEADDPSAAAGETRAWRPAEAFSAPGWVTGVPNAAVCEGGVWLSSVIDAAAAAGCVAEAKLAAEPSHMDVLISRGSASVAPAYAAAFHTSGAYDVRRALSSALSQHASACGVPS